MPELSPPPDDLVRRIAAVSPAHVQMVTVSPVHPMPEELPFFKKCQLWHLQAGPVAERKELTYLDNGAQVVHLDGSVERIYEANRSMGLALRSSDAPRYLRYFFANVGGGMLQIVSSVRDLVQLRPKETTEAAKRLVEETNQSIVRLVDQKNATLGWQALFTAVWDDLLLSVEVRLDRDGTVTVKNKKLLTSLEQPEQKN